MYTLQNIYKYWQNIHPYKVTSFYTEVLIYSKIHNRDLYAFSSLLFDFCGGSIVLIVVFLKGWVSCNDQICQNFTVLFEMVEVL